MKRFEFFAASVLWLLSTVIVAGAQTPPAAEKLAKRTTLAVRYVENKKTTVNLTGTPLAPRVTGRADVEYKRNDARIRLKIENLDNPQTFGAFYTTFIVWAITPEGLAENLIEIPTGYTAELQTRTNAQTFGLVVTAEPHSAVKYPSQKVVAETSLPRRTTPGVQTVQAEYSADRGALYETAEDAALKPDYSTPRLVLGARRALDIARRAGAKEFVGEEWRQASEKLATLEQLWPRNLKDENRFSGLARDVMRLGQLARELAVEREEQARIENERQERMRRLTEAREQAERATAEAERARREAERVKAEAERARAEAERAERSAAEERARREQAAREAETLRARAEAERRQAEEATRRAEAERAAARAEADTARQQAEQAKRERDAALQRLYVSLSEILDTKRETRGFIVNIGDVLFDTGRATLKPAAREKLSKLAGILLAYPGTLMLEIEGHTDSVGSDELNNRLSQARAESVRDYLAQAGVKPDRIKAVRGFGKTKPIATNDTAAGRQMNRRVEVVIEDQDQSTKPSSQ